MDCIFCRIIARALPAEILYESARVISILDINPIHHGHALVIPKAHCTDFLSVPDEDLHEVLRVTQIVARALVDALSLDGFNIFSNNGRIAGQSVFHFHMHVTPRYPDDDIRFVLKLKSYPGGAMGEFAAKIRAHLPAPQHPEKTP
ncbi:MAG TPA: HIT family protein [Bacteroidota bacterium]|nr:HIT family protein [Bacteroidota bacterium]